MKCRNFRLRKTDDLDGRESMECDQPTLEMALLYFGHELKSVLALQGDVLHTSLRAETMTCQTSSENLPVYVLK